MKVAIYTIALNEEIHVERWYNSSKEADYHIIADTGSSDKTVEIANSLGIQVHHISVKPWRFDDARNAALCLVPSDADYCIIMDMDEILIPGWKDELQKAYDAKDENGLPRPKHKLITDYDKDGNPTTSFYANRIHTRDNYRWRHPIHEAIYRYPVVPERYFEIGLLMEHHQDVTKSRGQYLGMLEMAVDEDPTSSRNLYYYARELFYNKEYLPAKRVFEEYLKYVQNFPEEKAYALRYLAKCDPNNAEKHLKESIKTFYCREGVLALANHYYIKQQWKPLKKTAFEALEITERLNTFMTEEWAYGPMAYDLIALASWQLEEWDDALRYGELALEMAPEDERLQNNVKFYRSKIDELHIRSDGG